MKVKYDAIMIECNDENISEDSIVYVTPFDTKDGNWMLGLCYMTTMREALKSNKKKVTKDKHVEKFLEKYYKRKGKDVKIKRAKSK